jgi:Protein of unknown function (DUF2537)
VLHLGGRGVLQERDVGDVRLTDDLRAALREWVTVAETVRRSGDAHELDLLSRRGRQLALRVADALGRPVEFVDPVSGEVESIRAEAHARAALAPEPPGPIPWGTGLAVATFFAVLVAIADVVLAGAFAGAFGLLWIPANLLVTMGTAPSLWMAREVPFWRWPALGAAVGLVAAWVVMLLGLLG